MQKIILYYKFIPLPDPEMVRLWQRALCEKLDLRGRIIVSPHGINGTLGGDSDDLKAYVKAMKLTTYFKGTDFKWSDGSREDFPKLSIRVRDEIVTFKAADELRVDNNGVVGGGKHLSPAQVHQLVQKRGNEVVFMDGRNAYEAAVGKFKNAVVPNVRTSKDFKAELDKPTYQPLKDKPIVTYCTGGIRCEVLTSLMKNRGFKEVYQIKGGIVNYVKSYGSDGLWEGSLYVFDRRMGLKPGVRPKDIATCIQCGQKTSRYINCANKACNELIVMCHDCSNVIFCQNCQKVQTAV